MGIFGVIFLVIAMVHKDHSSNSSYPPHLVTEAIKIWVLFESLEILIIDYMQVLPNSKPDSIKLKSTIIKQHA